MDSEGFCVRKRLARETHGIILLSVKHKKSHLLQVVRRRVDLIPENHKGLQTIALQTVVEI